MTQESLRGIEWLWILFPRFLLIFISLCHFALNKTEHVAPSRQLIPKHLKQQQQQNTIAH